ncbi:MAG: hypothetical protein HUN04_19115 [Desulfobacter sp.]|nr:MAG: hypothetical protein HUN04_19115 [Desulfobacter sp.]
MSKIITSNWIKPIILVSLLIGSIIFVQTIPVEITSGDSIAELFYLEK